MGLGAGLAVATAVALVGMGPSAAREPAPPALPAPWVSGCIVPAIVLWLAPDPASCQGPPPTTEPFRGPPSLLGPALPGWCATPAVYTGPQPGTPCQSEPPRRELDVPMPCVIPAAEAVGPAVRPGC